MHRQLIELNLMKSPWAYCVMAVTILIDLYLLYIFFTKRSRRAWAPPTPSDRSTPHSRFSSDTDELFDPLRRLLGYIIAIAAVGMLLYAVSPAIRPLIEEHGALWRKKRGCEGPIGRGTDESSPAVGVDCKAPAHSHHIPPPALSVLPPSVRGR
jgi:hypothetical protein